MNYIKVGWMHSVPDEPVLLYSELDDQRWERRKVELFADGRIGYADGSRSQMGTKLGEEQIPPLAQIAEDPQFKPEDISKDEFEAVWARATG